MSWRSLVGIGLLIVGVGFFLDRLDVIDFGEILSTWWPMIIILIGVIQLATRSVPVGAGALVILIGVFFQVNTLDLFDVNLGQFFWPALLIGVGSYLLITRSSSKGPMVNTDDRLSSFVAFGGVESKLESQAFQGGSAIALFGGSEIDLSQARLAPEGAELDLTAAFGGVEVTVPADWKVRMSGLPLFGGLTNKTAHKGAGDEDAPELTIRGFAAFGGVEVHN